MDITKFKNQHVEIMEAVTRLRVLARTGVEQNAAQILAQILSISSTIRLHLSVEDSVLYPAVQKSENPAHRVMGARYQSEMTGLAAAYTGFANKWSTARHIAGDAEGFKSDANTVFKALHDRIQRENTEFYPVLEKV